MSLKESLSGLLSSRGSYAVALAARDRDVDEILRHAAYMAEVAQQREEEFARLLDQLQAALEENAAWSRAGRDEPPLTPEQRVEVATEVAKIIAPKRVQQRHWLAFFKWWDDV